MLFAHILTFNVALSTKKTVSMAQNSFFVTKALLDGSNLALCNGHL